ncbi:DUF6630 family protein [Flavobacterium foetidum]|uniref:DUF6630 family protein n=1 Tax=Flavobacterium foetidum TaxID=2026681 RepID=UPI001074A7A4|nr:hypothetical protein [Flavobacterium foetidum]KAF2513587.1 hypothetical protein E0W73_15175 [Flavobacterium foetidum]
MKSLFSNLFNRNNDPESIISFDVINPIYSYLYNQQGSFEFKVKGIQDQVWVNLFYFPGSFDHDEARKEIRKAGFTNSYEVLNELYKKVDIGTLTPEMIEEGLEYDFIHIQFYSEPTKEVKQYFKRTMNNFVILFCCTNSLEINDFKILYSSTHFTDYTKGLLDMEQLDFNNPKNETQKIGVKDFKLVLQGICEYLDIEIPKTVELPSNESLIEFEEVTEKTFEEFINLVSRGDFEEEELKEQSKMLFENFKRPEEDYYDIIEGHFEFFESIDAWNSDWKFDPEDAEYFISEMIGEDLNFEYPEETYSHDLFPYIQTALEKHGLELMSYNTNGDNYLFFVANKNEVSRILELSELTKIEIDQL